MSTQSTATPSSQGSKALPQTDRTKAEAQAIAQSQAAQGDHGKQPETSITLDRPE